MIYMETAGIAALLFQTAVCTLTAFGQNERPAATIPETLQGTINAILANGNGLVAVTDSLLSSKVQQNPPWQGRKLFKLDDRTICTVAGFYRQPGPDFGPYGAGARAALNQVERAYVERRTSYISVMSVEQKLQTFTNAVAFSFGVASTAAIVSGIPVPKEDIVISVAGFDVDGSLKVGQVDLLPRLVNTSIEYVPSNSMLLTVDKILAQPVLAGMPVCARDVLDHAEKYSDKYPSVARYAKSMAANKGRSLTLRDLLNLGESLEAESSACHPNEVGGKVETATLENGAISSIDNEIPPGVDIDQLVEPKAPVFTVLVGTMSRRKYPGPLLDAGPNTAVMIIGGVFENTMLRLDNVIVTGASFDSCAFFYSGSPLSVFDGTNTVKNSTLQLGKGVDAGSPFVVQLKNAFPDLKILGPVQN